MSYNTKKFYRKEPEFEKMLIIQKIKAGGLIITYKPTIIISYSDNVKKF